MTANFINTNISNLKFTELQAYLRNTGWNRVAMGKNNIALFQKEIAGNYYETVLPLSKDFADFNARIYDVLNELASAENREPDQILTDLSLPPADVVRFRVRNRDTNGGTISFLEGFNLLENAKKALLTTASDILQPEKYHKRLGLKGAQQFIEECRLGQTEKGSFVAAVICPFINHTQDDKPQQLSIFNHSLEFANSFTRKVTTRLMDALSGIKSAIDNGEENKIIDQEGPEMVSANFLESILDLNPTKENSEIEIITSWSVFANPGSQPTSSIKFSNDYIPVFENMISKIKPPDEGINDVFIGRVSMTKADPDPYTRTEGEILFNYLLGDEEKVAKAKIILDKQSYSLACEAHKNGKTVRVKGRLVSSGRGKVIEAPVFEIVG